MSESEKQDLLNRIKAKPDGEQKEMMLFMWFRNWGKVLSITSLEDGLTQINRWFGSKRRFKYECKRRIFKKTY